jgi:hypothetical protein
MPTFQPMGFMLLNYTIESSETFHLNRWNLSGRLILPGGFASCHCCTCEFIHPVLRSRLPIQSTFEPINASHAFTTLWTVSWTFLMLRSSERLPSRRISIMDSFATIGVHKATRRSRKSLAPWFEKSICIKECPFEVVILSSRFKFKQYEQNICVNMPRLLPITAQQPSVWAEALHVDGLAKPPMASIDRDFQL